MHCWCFVVQGPVIQVQGLINTSVGFRVVRVWQSGVCCVGQRTGWEFKIKLSGSESGCLTPVSGSRYSMVILYGGVMSAN